MNLNIRVFANLKDFFENEFTLEAPDGIQVDQLLPLVAELNPDSKELLGNCRVAVDDDFVEKSHVLQGNDNVFLIPPSSGG